MILGGNKESITSDEVVAFIQKLYPLLSSGLDLLYIGDLEVITTTQNVRLILETVRSKRNALHPHQATTVITTHQHLLRVVEKNLI